MPDAQPVEQLADLSTIGGGAAAEKFLAELRAVLLNIRDPNTQAKAKRKIVIEWVFMPDEDREKVLVLITSKSTTAATKPGGDVLYVGKHDGEMVGTVMHRPGSPSDDHRQGVLHIGKKGSDK